MSKPKILTPKQIQEVMQIVDSYQTVFIASSIGTDVLTDYEKWLLKESGFDIKKLKGIDSNLDQAYKFGILSNGLKETVVKKMTYPDFKRMLEKQNFLPLTPTEIARSNYLKERAYGDVRVFGSRIQNDVRSIIMDESQKGLDSKKTAGSISKEIGRKTGDWERDFDRISDYVLHHSFNEGRVSEMQRQGGSTQLVYFDVYPGACKHCIRLYLTGPVGSEPKVFTIKELRDNGTNIGRKVEDWKPTISGIHPHCRCTANKKREGYEWDEETRSFTKPKEVEEKYQGLVKVTVN